MDNFLEFYTKLCEQEKTKLKKIKELVNEREEMLAKINSILDQNVEQPKRPQTAQVKKQEKFDVNPFDHFIVPSMPAKVVAVKKESKFNEKMFICKICLLKPVTMTLFDYQITELSPANLNADETKQNTLKTFLSENGSSIDQVYRCIIEQLETMNSTDIYPE